MDLKWLDKEAIYKLFQSKELHKAYVEKKYKYLDLGYRGIDSDLVCVAFIDSLPAGLLQLGQAPSDENLYWMKYVTVHPDFRQQGVARALITEMMRHLSQIENARVELSSYEPEGEVMISMVQDVANQYPDLSVKHKTILAPYQDAKRDFIQREDTVWVDDPETGYRGWAMVVYFLEYQTPIKALVKKKDSEESLEVDLKYLTHQK